MSASDIMSEPSKRRELLRYLSPQISRKQRESTREQLISGETDVVVSIGKRRFNLHMDVLCYWSDFAKALSQREPKRSFKDEPIHLESEEVPSQLFPAFMVYFYSGQLPEDPRNLDGFWTAADFLGVLPARALIACRQPQAKRHYTRVLVPNMQKTLDLHTLCYEYGHELFLTIERSEFHHHHLRRDNGDFLLESTVAGIQSSVCYLRFGPIVPSENPGSSDLPLDNTRHEDSKKPPEDDIHTFSPAEIIQYDGAYRGRPEDPIPKSLAYDNTRDEEVAYQALFEDILIRNAAAVVGKAHILEDLVIIGVPPRDSTARRLKNVLLDGRRARHHGLTVHFYEPCWDALEELNDELRADDSTARANEEANYRKFQENVASAFR